MLDALSDFWKPSKKDQSQVKLNPQQLQLGSSIGFGFVPQASLSGRRVSVVDINTYQFGQESLTSFVLSNDKDPAVSMIVAESEGEQYLAISRKLSADDRASMFDAQELENLQSRPEVTQLTCRNVNGEFKGWVVTNYKRELQGMTGRVFKGDFRKAPLPAATDAKEFKYMLLVSESNEHAIEIEKYADGKLEIYATVYRRLTDIGEVTHPTAARPDIKLASPQVTVAPAAPQAAAPQPLVLPELSKPEPVAAAPAPVVEAPKVQAAAPATVAPAIPAAAPPVAIKDVPPVVAAPVQPQVAVQPTVSAPVSAPAASVTTATPAPTVKQEEKKPMEIVQPLQQAAATNGAAAPAVKPVSVASQPAAQETFVKQDAKAVTKSANPLENESIECDLRVANKIIDEAIRNEMRLNDVVRRIIELPVAYPEAVHIPVTLSDEDYALLAIRYGIASTDRNTIKTRILEELNNFSGAKKAAA
ncbi:MAG: hypothetical protein SFT92_07695 [Rickettsiales bacterium]|nr:hypothetical protein [Rickettsiales bacterium]